ncbi:MAG: 3-hydroxyacyl-ACP dehydratase FabZ [Deltaproteobacteria bacterium]|nr:3-hydroxyacyl-ACP dehydratase FabZ [Deltaproteobacteria bacterium]
MDLPLTYQDIIQILPHRPVGIKNVTIDEPFFEGHFPGNPIMPGVLVIEAMAQVGGILARLSVPESMNLDASKAIYFAAIDKVKFRRPVVPGDQIVFELTAMRKGTKIWKMKGKAIVQEEIVAEAELVAAIG